MTSAQSSDAYYFESLLKARLAALCADCDINVPVIIRRNDFINPMVTIDCIWATPLPDPCAAAHRVHAWELAEIWRGISMHGKPFAKQQLIARYRMELEG